MRSVATFIAAFCSALAAVAAPGDPDTTFGAAGVANIPVQRSNDVADVMLPQGDGKVVAVGGSDGVAALARYNADGTLDASFGANGRVRRKMPWGLGFHSRAAARQADGRIVVAGICGSICLARFESDGSLDSTFGLPGATLPDGFVGTLRMAIAGDGGILVALKTTASEVAVYRFQPGGAVDAGFGTSGRVTVARGDYPAGVLIQPDGKIVVVAKGISVADGIVVERFTAAGALDASFSIASGSSTVVQSAILQPDGKILIAGLSPNPPSPQPSTTMVMRLLSNGTLDPSFGGGTGIVHPLGDSILNPQSLALRADGRIVMSLVPYGMGAGPFEAMQLDASGALDASFGTGGRVTFGFSPAPQDFAFGVAPLPDGKVLLVGSSRRGSPPDNDFALARLTTAGAVDPAFGSGGLVTTEFNSERRTVRSIRDSSGKLVVLASPPVNAEAVSPNAIVARLLADGTMDTSFGSGGQIPVALGTEVSQVNALAVQADGAVLVAGTSTVTFQSGGSGVVMRLLPSGGVDTTFGPVGRRSILENARAVAVEALGDGRILVAGKVRSTLEPDPLLPDRADAFVARLLADGSPDTAFGPQGGGGIVRIVARDTLGAGGANRLSLAVQADGKVVVSGLEWDVLRAVRLNPDGSIDGGFAMASYGYPNPPSRYVSSRGAMVHADGRVTLVGSALGDYVCFNVVGQFAAFARVNASGAADAQTSGAGFLAGSLGSKYPAFQDARLDAQDRVVAAGTHYSGCLFSGDLPASSTNQRIVARFTPAGALDTSFGTKGLVAIGLPFSPFAYMETAVHVSASGRIVVSGFPTTPEAAATLYAFQGGGDSSPTGTAADVDGDGIPNAVEMTESRDPFVRDNDIFAVTRLYAMQQYRDFLGREGDSAGVDFWTGRLNSGAQTRAQMVETFFNSAEFQGLASPGARLYFAYFLRIPDYGGLNYWIGRYRAGEALEGISNLFATSPEFVNMYGALTNGQFVTRVYQNVLGREPDSGGLAYWTAQIDGGMTRGQMMLAFSESPEYRDLIANEVYVTMMYVGMLRRSPDSGGFAYWVGYMDAGNSGLALTSAFIAAPEYRGRFLP